MGSTETQLDAEEYLRSLSVDREFSTVYDDLDGASLFRIGQADEDSTHFVILTVRCEHKHRGHALLLRVLPVQWRTRFAHAINRIDRFEAHHYGPAL